MSMMKKIDIDVQIVMQNFIKFVSNMIMEKLLKYDKPGILNTTIQSKYTRYYYKFFNQNNHKIIIL